jgi:hypothetical protein
MPVRAIALMGVAMADRIKLVLTGRRGRWET